MLHWGYMGGKRSRDRGQRGERAVAKLLEEATELKFSRTPLSGGWAMAKTSGKVNAAGDLVCEDPDFPYSIECKNQEGWTHCQLLTSPKCKLHSWWQQTLDQTPEGKAPLLVYTRNRQPWFCMVLTRDNPNLEGIWYKDRTICLFTDFLKDQFK